MTRFARKVHVGSAPGVLRAPLERRVEETSIQVMRYGLDGVDETTAAGAGDLAALAPGNEPAEGVTWIDIVGLHDVELLDEIGRLFGIHPLALEDVVNVGQRPKVDEYGPREARPGPVAEEDKSLYLVMRLFHRPAGFVTDGDRTPLAAEQVSLFVRPGLVISFQEVPGDCFEPVRERIRRGNGRIRSRGSDYLTYALVDALVDSFYPVLETLGEEIEALEGDLIDDPAPDALDTIHLLRRDLLQLRRAVWPLREMTRSLLGGETPLLTEETRVFLRDCYDHAVEVLEILETYREIGAGMQEVYLSTVSQKMNEVMKVLTIIATIFIPLTFIAGIYGMNFDYMPELAKAWAYPACLGLMAVIGLGLVVYFKRKGWM